MRRDQRRFNQVPALPWWAIYVWLAFMAYQLAGPFAGDWAKGPDFSGLRAFDTQPGAIRDAVENLLLAVPAGVLGALSELGRGAKAISALRTTFLPVAILAVGMELLQGWMPTRNASFFDAFFMFVGALAGWVTIRLGGSLFDDLLKADRLESLKRGLAFGWIGLAWIPTNLQLQPDGLARGMGALHGEVSFVPGTFLWSLFCWLGFWSLVNPRRVNLWWLAPLIAWAGLVVMPGRQLGWEELLGGLSAPLAWRWLRRSPGGDDLILVGLLAAVAVQGMGWAPTQIGGFSDARFTGDRELLQGSLLVALIVIGQHYFPLAAGVVLGAARFNSLSFIRRAVPLSALLLIGLEVLRILLIHQHFRFSPFLVLAVFVLLNAAVSRHDAVATAIETRDRVPGNSRSAARKSMPLCMRSFLDSVRFGDASAWRHLMLGAVAAIAIVCVAMAVVLKLPQVPYNVRELFGGRTLWLGLPLFAGFVFWTAGAPGFLARVTVHCGVLHVFQPLLLVLAALPSWIMLRFAVSAESLWDILGFPVLGWPGDWELMLRYLAFCAPALLWLFIWNLLFHGHERLSWSFGLAQWVIGLVMAAPSLALSKLLVVDLAATDNVRELVSDSHPGALLALFAVLGLVTLNGVLLGWSSRLGRGMAVFALIFTPVSFLASGLLLASALTPEAVAFLLGPDRRRLIEPGELWVRGLVAYVASAVAIGISHRLVFFLLPPWPSRSSRR